ncbi:unnamed protein product [Colias eurytheme]|nr:unnamed protein product [Colias eurytheme]
MLVAFTLLYKRGAQMPLRSRFNNTTPRTHTHMPTYSNAYKLCRRDVRRRDIATSLGGGGLSIAPPVRQRVLPRVPLLLRLPQTVSECACSECYVLGRMRILLSELGLSGACLGLTLEPRAASEDSDKPAPGQRPHDDSPPSTSVFIFAFVV